MAFKSKNMRKPEQEPKPGDRLLRFVGDRICFTLHAEANCQPIHGWRAFLRTTLGRAHGVQEEIIEAVRQGRPSFPTAWADVPLEWDGKGWKVQVPLVEVGYFRAKCYLLDPQGWQHWPEGEDAGIAVHPAAYRTGNTIYCAFTRMFGSTKGLAVTANPGQEAALKKLDEAGYTVIPPSGKFRDLVAELPHIFDRLGCRILHLLPVNPTPTTYARFGRFGSPYACEDLTGIDPALVEFDRRTTGVDQFRELACGVHRHGGKLFLDMVINHTGWGSILQENRPEWFMRRADGLFVSPGAWGVTWEDLVELEHNDPSLREYLADAFLEWCRRGVDGFRCDAGYKVPVPVWEYITARVRQEYPDTVFLLEGLGGGWGDTEALLTEGGMQWAYSELFQNYTGGQVAGYLDHALHQSARCGVLVHYSETHDNERLASKGRAWSLLRNRLCALTSVSGGYGFTCGVEWLAPERVNVHSSRGLAWDNPENIVPELAQLNRLVRDHPCFFDGAQLQRVTPPGSEGYGLLRTAANGIDQVLVLVNSDISRSVLTRLDAPSLAKLADVFCQSLKAHHAVDLLGQSPPAFRQDGSEGLEVELPPGAAYCLAVQPTSTGISGGLYLTRKHQEAAASRALAQRLPLEVAGGVAPDSLAPWVAKDLSGYLGAVSALPTNCPASAVLRQLQHAGAAYPRVVTWRLADQKRLFLVPPGHWIVVLDEARFRVRFDPGAGRRSICVESFPVDQGQAAFFYPPEPFLFSVDATLEIERYGGSPALVRSPVRLLAPGPHYLGHGTPTRAVTERVLLTNGRGGMARLAVDLGRIQSKYDCLLGANLHPSVPVDRHVLAKRVRIWANADGFLSELNANNLATFSSGPPVRWSFIASGGDGRGVGIDLVAEMVPGKNTVVLRLERVAVPLWKHRELPPSADVRLTVRVDIEDRGYHGETKRTPGAEAHFGAHTHSLPDGRGFEFTPASDRVLRVFVDAGKYHPQPEWCVDLPHSVEASRGMCPTGDAYSPGWFEMALPYQAKVELTVTAETGEPLAGAVDSGAPSPAVVMLERPFRGLAPEFSPAKVFEKALIHATQAFVVAREDSRTVIAGYPWFLDWGRDTLICARGLLAAGMSEEVLQILRTFGRFESQGTLPNAIHGEDASNRDTSDAPLWYGVVCEDLAILQLASGTDAESLPCPISQAPVYSTPVQLGGRCIGSVLRSIAAGYLAGTPNGIRVDPASGLVWSPSHFTWMDTNYPASSPRQGYPICLQVLWYRLLRQLHRLGAAPVAEPWERLAARVEQSIESLFWREDLGYYADVLTADSPMPARACQQDTALRSNYLLTVSLGLVKGEKARRCVLAALRHLVLPGALRSLAPLQVEVPLPVHAADGRLLNDPSHPYWGRYEGDEDTRRKPAYHNGTGWTWTFPSFCEALALAWDRSPEAVAAAKAYLGSCDRLLAEGCLGHLPEIVDGDYPHHERGCDAQAWGATEALRVWKWLESAK